MDDKILKAQEAALKANVRLANKVKAKEDQKRKRRNGRLMKLGILAEQFFLAGDLTLLSRFETAAQEQFAERAVDRADFEFDDAMNWFDQMREEAMLRKSQKGEQKQGDAKAPASSSAAGAPAAPAGAGGAKGAPAAGARANGAGAGGGTANGHPAGSGSSPTASA